MSTNSSRCWPPPTNSTTDTRRRPWTRRRRCNQLRNQEALEWRAIASRLGLGYGTTIYLYGCTDETNTSTCGPRRAVIATLALAGPRVSELCALDNQDVSLTKARLQIRDSKTQAGIRALDIHPALLDELTAYRASYPAAPMDAPAFPTRTGTRRDRSNVLQRVVKPVLARANEIRASQNEAPILVHVTPHTFRRTYITFLLAAGYELPYVQAQVGHVHPHTTLAIYAQVMARGDRDQLRTEIRELLGVGNPTADTTDQPSTQPTHPSRPSPACGPPKRPQKAARLIYDRQNRNQPG
jgi:integrase